MEHTVLTREGVQKTYIESVRRLFVVDRVTGTQTMIEDPEVIRKKIRRLAREYDLSIRDVVRELFTGRAFRTVSFVYSV